MKAEDLVDRDTCTTRCVNWFKYSDQLYHLTEYINEHKIPVFLCVSNEIRRRSPLEMNSGTQPEPAEAAREREGRT